MSKLIDCERWAAWATSGPDAGGVVFHALDDELDVIQTLNEHQRLARVSVIERDPNGNDRLSKLERLARAMAEHGEESGALDSREIDFAFNACIERDENVKQRRER